MKKTLLILILLRCITVSAQIRISDSKQSLSDGAAADARTSVDDPDGQLCSVLKLETKLNGWTFDAGLAGIIDTRYGDGIRIWCPSGLEFPGFPRARTDLYDETLLRAAASDKSSTTSCKDVFTEHTFWCFSIYVLSRYAAASDAGCV